MKHIDRTGLLEGNDSAGASHVAVESAVLPGSVLPADASFDAVFDSSGQALVVIDPLAMIHRANGRARELLRLKNGTGALVGLKDFLCGPPADVLVSFCADPVSSSRAQSLDASLASGFPIRILLRSILPGSSPASLLGGGLHRPAR